MRHLRRLFRPPLLLALALALFAIAGAVERPGSSLAQESAQTPGGIAAAVHLNRLKPPPTTGARPAGIRSPSLAIEPFVRPDLAVRLRQLRPAILAAAARHNRPEISGMTSAEFAQAMVLIIYNENNGWLEDDIEPLRVFTPLYQDLQRRANASALGANFSVWPTNLRPSVALEILRNQVPVSPTLVLTVPLRVRGSTIDLASFERQEDLLAAVTAEISRDDLAIEYLAANLERALYRAHAEGVPVTWRTLAAWHNQGIVDPRAIMANPTTRDYLRRAAAYLSAARTFVTAPAPGRRLQAV